MRDGFRFVAWNVRGGVDKKWAELTALAADVAVLAEVPPQPAALTSPSLGAPELSWEWEGPPVRTSKGLAVAGWDVALRRRIVAPVAGTDDIGRWVTAAVAGTVLVVGIWSCPLRGGAQNYAREVDRALDGVGSLIGRHPQVIVAGDFNLDAGSSAMRTVAARLGALGLSSAYHLSTGDPMGWESASTFGPRHAGESAQHIDYVWLSAELADRLVSLRVGERGPSDHSPIICDFGQLQRTL